MPEILRIAVPVPIDRLFDYLPPEGTAINQLEPGIRLLVPFGRRNKVGVLMAVARKSDVEERRLKRAQRLLDEKPLLGPRDLDMLRWANRYYHHAIGEVVGAAFPVLLRRGKSASLPGERHLFLTEEGRSIPAEQLTRAPRQAALLKLLSEHPNGVAFHQLSSLKWDWRRCADMLEKKGWLKTEVSAEAISLTSPPSPLQQPFSPNAHQHAAIDAIKASLDCFGVFLLEGVTGSGKTEVYLQLIDAVLRRGGQAMVLLPEISLTPQIEARFRDRLPVPIAVFHSGLSETERLTAWLRVQTGKAAILLGTRSAVFTPMHRPALIILDEEHDASFKQQDGFRFSARDIAIVRARNHNIPIVLGTATPSLETLLNADKKRYRRLQLPERAGSSVAPTLRILDIRNRKLTEGLAAPLITDIEATLARGEQAMLFLNRRGFAPTLICHSCGWVARCTRCDANLVVHFQDRHLRCHHCGQEQRLTEKCGQCGTLDLRALGLGTERVEKALALLFPHALSARIDRDTTRLKGSLKNLLDDVNSGKIDILLGTQMLAKGHHFPNVTLVAILDADAGLFSTDFRAAERLAQLIVQVTGRAGRADKAGRVVLQTRHPDHPLLLSLVRQGYGVFARDALIERREARLPPYSHMALFRALAADMDAPTRFLQFLAAAAFEHAGNDIDVMGPVPAPMTRRAGRYRFQLLLRSPRREPLHRLIDRLLAIANTSKDAKHVRWSVDVDPIDLY